MGAFITKQPNGLYCRFSTVVDCPTHINMTKEDYINICMERAREEAEEVLENYTRPFEWIEEYFHPNNMSKKEFKECLNKMELPKEDVKMEVL
jgi:hypothetical protein